MVYAADAETLEVSTKQVLETYIRETSSLVHLTINGENIISTYDHPYYVKDKGFVSAEALWIGAELIDKNGNTLYVEQIYREKLDDQFKTVYNFKVDGLHTYFVGNIFIWVHNAECTIEFSNKSRLDEKEFKVELEEKYGDPDKFKPGTVMEQSPKAGEKRKQGSLIILTICKGAELKAVPDVTGMSLSKAEQQLQAAGFKVGKVTRKHVDGGKIGAVLSQSPKGLDKAPKGTGIDLVINEGDKPVPDIIGKSLDEAKGMLEQAGLKLGEIKKVQDANAKKNVVLACNPGVGSNLNDGAAVAITVARRRAPMLTLLYRAASLPTCVLY